MNNTFIYPTVKSIEVKPVTTKINGVIINKIEKVIVKNIRPMTYGDALNYIEETKMTKKDYKQLKKVAAWSWGIGLSLVTRSAFAASATSTMQGDLWVSLLPVFGLFKEVAMVLGGFALMSGVILLIFKRRLAVRIISTSAIVIGGVFLVPAAVMLAAIIGEMVGHSLEEAFRHMQLQNSVPTSPVK